MALDRRSIGCLYISKIQRQFFKHDEICENVQRSSLKGQKKNKTNEFLKSQLKTHKIHSLASQSQQNPSNNRKKK